MSNSIWKTPDDYDCEQDDELYDEAIVVDAGYGEYRAYSSFYYVPHHCEARDCYLANTVCWKRWTKVTDLIAQADKVERLQKAVDLIANMEQRLCIDDPVDILDDVLKIAKDEIE